MKKYLLALILVAGSLKAAMPQMDGFYGELGLGPFPLPIPVFGLGARTQRGHHGLDLSVKASSVIHVTAVKGSLLYHYYFKPNLCSQFYAGLGASAGTVFWKHDDGGRFNFVAPEFAFGKQYMTKTGGLRFFQASASFPNIGFDRKKHDHKRRDCDVLYMPLVTLSYGVIF